MRIITNKRCFSGFTLAEMMVVMLILTIILAAFAPLMTKRKMVDMSNPWRYASNNSDIYYGMGANQTTMIGQTEKANDDPNSRLIIASSGDGHQAHITFKNDHSGVSKVVANLLIQNTEGANGDFRFGGPYKLSPQPPGNGSTAFGLSALSALSSGSENTALGYTALNKNTTGYSNTALGVNTLEKTTGSNNNTAVGARALRFVTSGNMNSAVGNSSLREVTTGAHNSALGSGSALFNKTGNYNTAIGKNALYNNSEGSYNTAIGNEACINVKGSNKTCIGSNSGPVSGSSQVTGDKNMIYVGTSESTVYIPGDLVVGKSAYLNADNANSYTAVRPRAWNSSMFILEKVAGGPSGERVFMIGPSVTATNGVISDKRLKNIGKPFTDGLEKINELKFYNFTLKNDNDKTPHVGVIAQDLQEVFPNAVQKGDDGYLRIRQDDMFYALINAVKQLDTFVQGIINELKVIEEKIDTLIKQENAKDKKIKELEKRLDKLEKSIEK